MEKEAGKNGTRTFGQDFAHGDDEPVLRPHRQIVLPQSATVNRVNIVTDEGNELSAAQKLRTQFLAYNYIGETAVMPGAWSTTGSEGNMTGEEIMFLADPKPIVDVTETSTIAEKDEKKPDQEKGGGFHKEVDMKVSSGYDTNFVPKSGSIHSHHK